LDSPTVHRRRNVLSLFQAYAESAMARGEAPKGLEQAFAAHLQISPSMWSQVKSSRPIGDKLARQIERHCQQPVGWLDEAHESAGLTPGEQQLMALALKAWRATDSTGRKKLKLLLKSMADSAE
jgi:hypothetical protein